ncbi:Uncharacterized protein conserved in bacteria [Mycobacteroides abscessus subsp. abscessus]|nr:Uncharacterized protein conserved in bacteria [Mycobacteroides abscessus subsp. abscessus]SHT90444.1 Uncharacterized protein conserved in bacteria [Mycobacteroides abscessus subsp. abscessus]SHV10828.1 Uncharacterized protein conserved in bacteria [Mycobacteroides abscessus subsp. abscessus]SIB16244.1 Uncharacterized protein conserved in bacteria [Mycobacteroides abscessus subsp. abscessus]SID34107.1 Uncharacterized protein conserved in bacteria [Mycobacteroides abscessus subsp. abscessus]
MVVGTPPIVHKPPSRCPGTSRALESEPGALAFFDSLNKTARWPFLFRLTTIKKPETRARRIAQYVELLAEGKTLH